MRAALPRPFHQVPLPPRTSAYPTSRNWCGSSRVWVRCEATRRTYKQGVPHFLSRLSSPPPPPSLRSGESVLPSAPCGPFPPIRPFVFFVTLHILCSVHLFVLPLISFFIPRAFRSSSTRPRVHPSLPAPSVAFIACAAPGPRHDELSTASFHPRPFWYVTGPTRVLRIHPDDVAFTSSCYISF